jgi:hypothetical protein
MMSQSVIAQLWCCASCLLVSLVGTDYRQQKGLKRQKNLKALCVLFILQQLYSCGRMSIRCNRYLDAGGTGNYCYVSQLF